MAKKLTDIKELATDELVDKISESRLQLRKARFAHAVSALEKPGSLKLLRKEIARLLTELNKRKKEEALKAN
jgi:large subunit ribosomal protein L29